MIIYIAEGLDPDLSKVINTRRESLGKGEVSFLVVFVKVFCLFLYLY